MTAIPLRGGDGGVGLRHRYARRHGRSLEQQMPAEVDTYLLT